MKKKTYSKARRPCGRFDSLGDTVRYLPIQRRQNAQLTDDGAPLDHDIIRGNTDGSLLDRERVLTDPRGHDGMEVWV